MTALSAEVEAANSRAAILRFVLMAVVALDLLAVVVGWSQYSLIARAATERISDTEAGASDVRYALVNLAQGIGLLGCGVLWLWWQIKAYRNLQETGSRQTTHSPGWSIGWWFIPFMNIVRPFQVHRELLLRSKTRNVRANEPAGPAGVVGGWWALLLIWNLMTTLVALFTVRAESIGELKALTMLAMGEDLASAVAAVLAVKMIAEISKAQTSMAIEIPSSPRTSQEVMA